MDIGYYGRHRFGRYRVAASRYQELILTADEQAQLNSIARSRSISAALCERARIMLACATGESNLAIARRFELNNNTVGKWRARFVKQRLAGLYDELRPGRPRTIDDERVAGLIRRTLQKKPKDGSTHWSVRRAAKESGISQSSVHRYLQLFSVKPTIARVLSSLRTPSSSRSSAMLWGCI